MSKFPVFLCLFFAVMAYSEPRIGYITIGPMLHWNSRNYEVDFSYGFEISFWSYAKDQEAEEIGSYHFPDMNKLAYGIDLGLDFEKGKSRFYLEPQLNWKMVGLSMGPVFQKRDGRTDRTIGFQSSLWSQWFPIADFRYRHIDGENYHGPGLYAKLPVPIAEDL